MSSKEKEFDDALKDVLEQLEAAHLTKHDVPGDGNCMFHALALVLDNNNNNNPRGGLRRRSAELRRDLVKWVQDHRKEYANFFPNDDFEDIDEYLRKMSKGGEWGDNLMLKAAADMTNTELKIVSTQGKEYNRTIAPDPAHVDATASASASGRSRGRCERNPSLIYVVSALNSPGLSITAATGPSLCASVARSKLGAGTGGRSFVRNGPSSR